jgi:hypothetical protein
MPVIEELEEAGEAEERPDYPKRRESDDRVPLVGFGDAIRDAQADSSIAAVDRASAYQMKAALRSARQVHAKRRCQCGVQKCLIGPAIETTVA